MHADTPDQSPDPQILADLDAKREAALSGQNDRDAEESFWKAMFGLDSWHLLCAVDEQAMKAGHVPPMLTLRDSQERSLAPVYTSSDRASAGCVKLFEDAGNKQPFTVLALPVANAVAYLCAISAETPFVLVDNVPGELKAYGNTTSAIPGWYDHLIGPCPVECFGVLSRVAADTSHAGAFYSAYRCAASRGALFVIRTDDGELAVANEQERSFLPVFTDQGVAERQTQGMENVRIEAVSPDTIAPTHEDLEDQTGDEYIGVVFDPGIATLVMEPNIWKQALDSLGG